MALFRRGRAKTLNSVEEVAASKLSEAYSKVAETYDADEDSWDLQSPEGTAACTEFLREIDAASRAMRVEMASRDYRENFTVNYQVLFPGDDRHYRVDILTACTEQYSGIWLNGERYNFGEEVTKVAEALMQAWTELAKTIGAEKNEKGELKTSLRVFDEAWAKFEQFYIMGLMHIEDQAKKMVRDAIQQEQKLQETEASCMGSNCAECLIERAAFVKCISQLNGVANTERKGRTDLSVDILCDAMKLWRGSPDRPSVEFGRVGSTASSNDRHVGFGRVASTTSSTSSLGGVKNKVFGILRSVTNSRKNIHSSSKVVKFFPDEDECVDDASQASTASTEEHHACSENSSLADKDSVSTTSGGEEATQQSADDMSAAQCLAGDVVESFWHMRYYLRDISNSLERIDPNLSCNAELVSRLEDWEESWEVGRDYVHDQEMLPIVCQLVSFLKKAEKLEPALAEMTQECGADFCLCLPRLVWLYFLQDPESHMKLLQRFLPHRFVSNTVSELEVSEVTETSELLWDSSIDDLLNRYKSAQHEVTQLSKRVADEGCTVPRFLVQSVVAGPNAESQPEFSMELDLGPQSDSCALVHAIEERSIELQRHQPEEWNHFMMVIVRCFSQGAPKHRQRMGPKAPVPKLQPSRSRRSLWRSRPRLRTMPFPAAACPARNSR